MTMHARSQPQVEPEQRRGLVAMPPPGPAGKKRSGALTLGAGLVLTKARRRLWSTRRAIAVVRDLGAGSELASPLDGLQVDLVRPEDFTVLSRLVDDAVGIEYLYVRPIERTRRVAAGTMSVARTAQGDLVAFHFVHERHNHEALDQVAPGMYPQLPGDEILTEAVYCLPDYRGRALAPSMLQATGAIMAARGMRRAWAYLDTTNIAALRMFNRAGYQPSGEERVDRYRFGRFSTEFRKLSPKTKHEWGRIIAGSRPETP
jgi:RimJ/RimL family protein N-acetyltransferase